MDENKNELLKLMFDAGLVKVFDSSNSVAFDKVSSAPEIMGAFAENLIEKIGCLQMLHPCELKLIVDSPSAHALGRRIAREIGTKLASFDRRTGAFDVEQKSDYIFIGNVIAYGNNIQLAYNALQKLDSHILHGVYLLDREKSDELQKLYNIRIYSILKWTDIQEFFKNNS